MTEFTKEESIEMECDTCKARTTMHSHMDIWKLPDILVIQLKRFKFDHGHPEKIGNLVEFPV